jgi:hypothetical protein
MARRRVSLDGDVVETRRWASSWKPHAIMMGAPGGVLYKQVMRETIVYTGN